MNPSSGRQALAVYLNPAEIVVAEAPATVTTVLGSCVAVTLFSPRTRIGSICHAVLPSGLGPEPGKFADQAIRYMIDYFHEQQIDTDELVAKVFGGADMFPQMRGSRNQGTIGAQNIRASLAALEQAGINPAVVEVGGQQGRKLVFFSDTGDVYIKRVRKDQMRMAEEMLNTRGNNKKFDALSRNLQGKGSAGRGE
jgi:chemotaxis protein CheD